MNISDVEYIHGWWKIPWIFDAESEWIAPQSIFDGELSSVCWISIESNISANARSVDGYFVDQDSVQMHCSVPTLVCNETEGTTDVPTTTATSEISSIPQLLLTMPDTSSLFFAYSIKNSACTCVM